MSVLNSLVQQELDGIAEGTMEFTYDWAQKFPINPAADNKVYHIFIGRIILKGHDLIVAGSTCGLG
jgi:hypothetical protein